MTNTHPVPPQTSESISASGLGLGPLCPISVALPSPLTQVLAQHTQAKPKMKLRFGNPLFLSCAINEDPGRTLCWF